MLDELTDTALRAVGYVGFANYHERQIEAKNSVRSKRSELQEMLAALPSQTPTMLRLPGNDGGSMYVFAPAGMDETTALETVNGIIVAANREDAINDGGACDDGLTVEESIVRRLTEAGFAFPEMIETLKWDVGNPNGNLTDEERAERPGL